MTGRIGSGLAVAVVGLLLAGCAAPAPAPVILPTPRTHARAMPPQEKATPHRKRVIDRLDAIERDVRELREKLP